MQFIGAAALPPSAYHQKSPNELKSVGERGLSDFSLCDGISLSTKEPLFFMKRSDEGGSFWPRNGPCCISCQEIEIYVLKDQLYPPPSDPQTLYAFQRTGSA